MQYGPNSVGQISRPSVYRVTVNGQFAYRPLGVTIDWSTVTAIGGKNAKGTIAVTAVSGNITYTYGGQTTANVAYNADAPTTEAALELLSSIGNGNIRVSGTAPNFTYELIEDLRHTPRLAFTSTGANIAETQAGTTDVAETLPGGQIAPVGEKVLRAGTIIYRQSSNGKYGVALDTTTLVRGECYVVDRHYFQSIDLDQIGEVLDSGTVFKARLLVDGTGQTTLANFLNAFPGVRLFRD